MNDPFDLHRFVEAQEPVYATVLNELHKGKKSSHWMWFIFPQLKSLGISATAQHFGLASNEEARAYLDHSILGVRLRECVEQLLALGTTDPHAIFGSPDDMKLRSCLTLFAAVAQGERMFEQALDRFYGGVPDELTLRLLGVKESFQR